MTTPAPVPVTIPALVPAPATQTGDANRAIRSPPRRRPSCFAATGRGGVRRLCACADGACSRAGADARRALRSERRRRSPASTRHTPAPTHAARSASSALLAHVNVDGAPGPVPGAGIGDDTGCDAGDDTGAGAAEQDRRRRKATRFAASARPAITRAGEAHAGADARRALRFAVSPSARAHRSASPPPRLRPSELPAHLHLLVPFLASRRGVCQRKRASRTPRALAVSPSARARRSASPPPRPVIWPASRPRHRRPRGWHRGWH